MHNFRSNVGGCPTLFKEELVLVNPTAYTEVSNLYVPLAVEQYIVELDIAVNDPDMMHVRDALHDLLEEVFGISLSQLPALTHVVEQVTPWTQLHHNQVVLGSLERFKELYVTCVFERFQYFNLLHHLAFHALFLDLIFVGRFNGYEAARQSMKAQVDLAKGTLSKDLANFVELNTRLRHLIILLKAVSDHLCQQGDLSRPRAHRLDRLLTIFQLLDH